jgi:hypothetical protein
MFKSKIIIPIMKILFQHYNHLKILRIAIGIFFKLYNLKKQIEYEKTN